MNDQQVVSSLLAFYKQQGMDLSYVLDDPIFLKLPLTSKVEAIKNHAQEIVDGTSPGFNRIDRHAILARTARSIVTGGLTGASLGAALGAGVPGFDPRRTAIIGAVTGAASGLGSAVLSRAQELTSRKAVRNQLEAAAADPTDINAIGALSVKGIHGRQGAAREQIIQSLQEAAGKATSAEGLAPQIQYYIHQLQNAA